MCANTVAIYLEVIHAITHSGVHRYEWFRVDRYIANFGAQAVGENMQSSARFRRQTFSRPKLVLHTPLLCLMFFSRFFSMRVHAQEKNTSDHSLFRFTFRLYCNYLLEYTRAYVHN